jgi:flagellar M-ring protein FliF
VDRFISALRQFGIGRLAAILGVSAGVAAALAVMVFHLGSTPMSLLYGDIDPKQASSITAALDQAAVKYELSQDGTSIKVPSDKVASTRLLLAGKGVEISGSMGYEIFDKTSALGQTDFVQNLNAKRALEGELARTIATIQGVTSPRVLLVLPKRELFQDSVEEPKASITLGFTRAPSAEAVRAIQNLVASGVPGLKPDKVTIADQSGRLLSSPDSDDGLGAMAAERTSQTEQDMAHKIQSQLDAMLGPGHAKVTVNADLDMAHVTTQKEQWDPDGSVVRSSQTGEQKTQETSKDNNGAVTAAKNLPGATPEAGADQSGSTSGDTTETTNYMNSSTRTTSVVEAGAIKRVTVAVAVDNKPGAMAKNGDRGPSTPRTTAEIANIDALVKAAIGYTNTPDRQDVVTVTNMAFQTDAADGGTTAKPGLLSGFGKDDIMRGVEYLILLIVAAMTVFFVARPLFKTMNSGGGGLLSMPMMGGGAMAPGAGGAQLTGPGQGSLPQGAGGHQLTMAQSAEGSLDIARIEGQVKASAVKQVSDFVDRHPDESVSILRSWLHDA